MAWPGLVTMASVRPAFPSCTMSSIIGTCHACVGGGDAPSSSVETTCIYRQYWVSGQLGFLTRNWDGDQDGVLPNASGSSGPFQPLGWVRVWPSFWILVPGFCSSRSLNLVAIEMKTVAVNWNSRMSSYNWAQRPTQENKDTNGLVVTMSFPQWVGNPVICQQPDSFTDVGTLPTWEKGTHQPSCTTRVAI